MFKFRLSILGCELFDHVMPEIDSFISVEKEFVLRVDTYVGVFTAMCSLTFEIISQSM